MKERPIIMSAESVRAILDGRKTQTRRLIKSVRCRRSGQITEFGESDTNGYDFHYRNRWAQWNDVSNEKMVNRCPYGIIGDRLWVREAFATVECNRAKACAYKEKYENASVKWKSPIYMPRWASRLTLEITDIKVERLQDMRQRDAIAEGVTPLDKIVKGSDVVHPVGAIPKDVELVGNDYLGAYKTLWNSINAKRGYSWESNPWVWVISFRVVNNEG
jgi:hypothetical protein